MPLFVRISSTDWKDGGWEIEQSVQLSKWLKELDIDLIDCSSGGNIPDAKIPVEAGYQVQFAERIRKEVNIYTGAVGMITEANQANKIIYDGQADIVILAREMLRDPYWPLHAAKKLNVDVDWPIQYSRAK